MYIMYLDHVHLIPSLVPLPFQPCFFPFPDFFPSNLMSSSAILYFNKSRNFGPNKLRNLSGYLHSYLAIFIQQKQSFKTFLNFFNCMCSLYMILGYREHFLTSTYCLLSMFLQFYSPSPRILPFSLVPKIVSLLLPCHLYRCDFMLLYKDLRMSIEKKYTILVSLRLA